MSSFRMFWCKIRSVVPGGSGAALDDVPEVDGDGILLLLGPWSGAFVNAIFGVAPPPLL